MAMRLFKSHHENLFHYVTAVTFRRVPIFLSEQTCALFIRALDETRQFCPFKLIGYVIMHDHVHLIVNPQDRDISNLMRRIKGLSARRILDWLRAENHTTSLAKLALDRVQKRAHTHAVWQKDFSSIDLWSTKFVQQKLQYIHNNPVRAGLCNHPADWLWSSYRAYLPHDQGKVPIEIDWLAHWRD
jgi:REP element-mobilizing transposase RayT